MAPADETKIIYPLPDVLKPRKLFRAYQVWGLSFGLLPFHLSYLGFSVPKRYFTLNYLWVGGVFDLFKMKENVVEANRMLAILAEQYQEHMEELAAEEEAPSE